MGSCTRTCGPLLAAVLTLIPACQSPLEVQTPLEVLEPEPLVAAGPERPAPVAIRTLPAIGTPARRILVVGTSTDPRIREKFERAFVEELRSENVAAVAATTVGFDAGAYHEEAGDRFREDLRLQLFATRCDAIVVLHPRIHGLTREPWDLCSEWGYLGRSGDEAVAYHFDERSAERADAPAAEIHALAFRDVAGNAFWHGTFDVKRTTRPDWPEIAEHASRSLARTMVFERAASAR